MENGSHDTTLSPRRPRPKKKPANPLVKGILAFCTRHDIDIDIPNTGEAQVGHLLDTATEDVQGLDTENDSLSRRPSARPSHRSLSGSDIPKRYTIYAPLVLLPSNFSSQNPRWAELYKGLSDIERVDLFACIAERGFAGTGSNLEDKGIRIAISAPIAAEETEGDGGGEESSIAAQSALSTSSPPAELVTTTTAAAAGAVQPPTHKQNVLRSPSGLVPVYGDWGVLRHSRADDTTLGSSTGDSKRTIADPSRQDFERAFWTSTSQHKGITQCWAPLYTMFSRGNISEKARILGLSPSAPKQSALQSVSHTASRAPGQPRSQFPGLTAAELGGPMSSIDIVDFYVGIGYFAFCYLARGVRRVWGWDINPWSIEGLRRGCEKNGWGCLVVRVHDNGELALISDTKSGRETRSDGENVVKEIVARISQGDVDDDALTNPGRPGPRTTIKCVAFLGDNKWSGKVMGQIQREFHLLGLSLTVKHANLGLLPTSTGSWENAVKVIQGYGGREEERSGGWLHVHENVDIRHIETMKDKVVQDLTGIAHVRSDREDGLQTHWSVSCDHVHQVKTYAPGVMHCVFDIRITPNG